MKIAVTGIGLIEDVDKNKPVDLSELPREVRTVLRIEELALCAAGKAIKDANLSIAEKPTSIGLALGVDEGIDDCKARFFCNFLAYGPDGVSPLIFPFTSPNAITARVSIVFGIKGENITIANGSLSICETIAYSIDLLQLKKANAMVTGSVMQDCAAIVVLEDFELATKRGARIYSKIAGDGENFKRRCSIYKPGHKLELSRKKLQFLFCCCSLLSSKGTKEDVSANQQNGTN